MFFTFGAQATHCAVAERVLRDHGGRGPRRALGQGRAPSSSPASTTPSTTIPTCPPCGALGLWAGVELVERREPHTWFPRPAGFAQRVVAETLARGVWVYPSGSGDPVQDAVMIGPPFTISEDEIDELVGALRDGVDAAVASLG